MRPSPSFVLLMYRTTITRPFLVAEPPQHDKSIYARCCRSDFSLHTWSLMCDTVLNIYLVSVFAHRERMPQSFTSRPRPGGVAQLTLSQPAPSHSISCSAAPPSLQCRQIARAPSGSGSSCSRAAAWLSNTPPSSVGRLLRLPLNLLTWSSLNRVTT